MKKLIDKYTSTSLVLRILCGFIIGLVLALLFPKLPVIAVLGDLFVGALKAIAPVLVFVLVASSLANASNNIGKRFRTVIILYMVTTLFGALVAVVGSTIFPVTLTLPATADSTTAPGGLGEVISNLVKNVVVNPFQSITEANYLGILFWAIVMGMVMKKIATQATKDFFSNLSDIVSMSVRFIIQLAPFGILGLVYNSIATEGLTILAEYGRLLCLLVGCMLFSSLIVNPMLVAILLHKNPYPLVFRCLRESGLTAFFTRSSAANIPINMQLCEKLGLDKDMYSVSIPLGSTINMDGAASVITVMTLAACHTMHISVSIPTALLLSVVAALAACGASGVAGGSLLLIPLSCSLFGISNDIAMKIVAIGFIIGIVQDSVETCLNSSGDVIFTATAEFYERRKKGEKIDFNFKK